MGVCYVIDHPEADLDDLCAIIKGPDFPTGGIVMGRAGIRAAYATGRGYVIDHPEADLDDLCAIIKGPDFPTGGIVMGRAGIRAAYATGRGKIKVRARCEIEDMPGSSGRERIIVTLVRS